MVRLRGQQWNQTRLRRFYSDLLGAHDGSHADGQRHGGNLGQVVAEEAGVGQDGVLGQCLDPGPGHQTGARLVEGNVAVGSDTCHQHQGEGEEEQEEEFEELTSGRRSSRATWTCSGDLQSQVLQN